MKQFVLSGIVIAAFILFSFYYRFSNRSQVTLINPPKNNLDSGAVPGSGTSPQARLPYKDGTFAGDIVDAFYGNIQVEVAMQNGRIVDVRFLQYPNDRPHSVMLNQYALPILKSEAIQVQSASVDIVSGATDSSKAFIQSLESALNKAKNQS